MNSCIQPLLLASYGSHDHNESKNKRKATILEGDDKNTKTHHSSKSQTNTTTTNV